MCIIIYKKENAELPSYEILKRCFQRNPDGAGFCYINAKTNKIKMEKGFFSFNKFYKRLLEVQNEHHLLIHMRIATGGILDDRNCHPFKVNSGLYFAHNGILDKEIAAPNQIFSDTYTLNEILKNFHLKYKELKSEFFRLLFAERIQNNKIVFFGVKNAFILNEDLGYWEDGVWFSNGSYRSNTENTYYQSINQMLMELP